MDITKLVAGWRDDILNNEGINLSDEDLYDTALAFLREVQWRIPLSAVQQGELGPEYREVAQIRREVAQLVADNRAACFDYSEIEKANK